MLLKKSYFSDISLTKQKILQRRHLSRRQSDKELRQVC